MDNSTYCNYLKTFNLFPASCSEIGIHLEKYGVKRMCAAQVNEVDIGTVISIPQIKIFWCCRCHRVLADGSAENEHWHALIHFEEDRSRIVLMCKANSHHPTIAFKKILCPDQALGVFKYICCEGGKLSRFKNERSHTHYEVTSHVSPAWMKENNYLGVSQDQKELHNREICSCRRGKISKEKSGRPLHNKSVKLTIKRTLALEY